MTYTVTVMPSGHSFPAPSEQSILQSALDAGLTLPYGCRDGACGSCKGKIIAGAVDYGVYQESALTEAERNAGFALFCCARPRSDVAIEALEIHAVRDIPVKKLPSRVERLERAAPDVMIVSLKLPASERLQFLAGQYIELLLKDGRRRAFSIANAPHDDTLLQLHIRLVPGGRFTEQVFSGMKERDILRFEGPLGTFFLREESTKPVILVAGGTGFAPIKAVIEHALHSRIARPLTLYWGVRRRIDLYMNTLPESWAREHANFHYVPVLSEAQPEDAWTGRTGLVHHTVMEDHPDLSHHQVYACGAPVMIAAAKNDFTGRCGLPAEEFFADSFTYATDPT